MRNLAHLALLTILCCCSVGAAQLSELDEMALMERAAELQDQLQSLQIPERDAAEKALLELGSDVLDHLESPPASANPDLIERLMRIRLALETQAANQATNASTITFAGTTTVEEALTLLQSVTGNQVELGGSTPASIGQQRISLNWQDTPFWQALNELMNQANLAIDPYAGEVGKLALTFDPSKLARDQAGPDNHTLGEAKIPRAGSGVFDISASKTTASRNLQNPRLSYGSVTIDVRWEPRLLPISIDLPVAAIEAQDDLGRPIRMSDDDVVLSGIVQPEIPALQFSIPIGLVDRQVKSLTSLRGTLNAVLPGRIEKFRFKKIGKLSAGTELRRAGAIVTFDGVQKNDDVFGVALRLSFEEEHNALESHQGWVFDNKVLLENDARETFAPIAYETLKQANSEIAIEYYFQQNPAAMNLIYETPAAIFKVPVKFELTDIPLP